MCVKEALQKQINQCVIDALNIKEAECDLEISANQDFGDITIKVGFLYAKTLGITMEEVCEKVAIEVNKLDWVKKTSVLKGYLNISLKNTVFAKITNDFLYKTEKIQKKDIKVLFDYASINPTGPMHAGHLRSAVIADTVVNVFEYLGYEVCREYYLNDTGGQAKKLAQAVFARYLELQGKEAEIIEEYAGEYIKEIAEKLFTQDGNKWIDCDFAHAYERMREFAVNELLGELKADLADLDIKHDVYFSEWQMEKDGFVEETLNMLQAKGYVEAKIMDDPIGYKGEMIKASVKTLQMEGLDDRVKALTKTDGSHTYLLGDIATHLKRYQKGFDWIVDFFGADHDDHANVLKKVMQTLVPEKKIDIKTCQIVKFEKNGKEYKMSKRAGTYVTSKDIVSAVGKDIIRMEMNARKANSQLCLDVEKVMEVDMNNPVFYIQYAHARCFSVIAKHDCTTSFEDFWNDKHVKKLCLQTAFLHNHLETVIKTFDSHHLFNYLQSVAKDFHSLWTCGNENEDIRLVNSKEGLMLAQMMKKLLSQVMGLLGVKPLDELR